jgi:acylphosphatase
MSVQYEILVRGRVQGVGFRASARNQARSLNLKGWVENNTDGTVRVVICGKKEDCTQFIQWCRRGSGYSWVESLEIKEIPSELFTSFSIRY